MKTMKIYGTMLALLVIVIVVYASNATAIPMTTFKGNAQGVFTNPSGGVTTGVGTNHFTWGVGYPDVSSLNFTGKNFSVTTPTGYILGSKAQNNRPFFSLGTLSYHNGTIKAGTEASSVQLDTTVRLTSPVPAGPTAIPSQFNLVNTPNTSDPVASADYVYLPKSLPPVKLTTSGGAPITIEPAGFGNASSNSFTQTDKFFVFEGQSASSDLFARFTSPCEPIVRDAISLSVVSKGMQALFTPNYNLTLNEAAGLSGYDHFNWYQVVTHDPYPPAAKSNPTVPLSVPYVDPPIGGYSYQANGDDSLPFYWGENGPTATELQNYTTNTSLSFIDIPAEQRLQPGEYIGFTTSLVGVLPDNSWDALFSWNWITDYNGTVGGVSVRNNVIPADPGSGTGGVTILDTDLSAVDVPQNVRDLMKSDGARNVDVSPVPEPSTFILLLIGLLLFAISIRLLANAKLEFNS